VWLACGTVGDLASTVVAKVDLASTVVAVLLILRQHLLQEVDLVSTVVATY
jgi:hypothetical protein